ncbi:MAG: hypothetical protein J0L61_04675 [Planctomycetes bacterium]|nr:hypothetical protein [Planctomycetota bacterium]
MGPCAPCAASGGVSVECGCTSRCSSNRSLGGYQQNCKITLCHNNLDTSTEFQHLLIHELTHAYSFCNNLNNNPLGGTPDPCLATWCEELRAYDMDRRCDSASNRERCLIDSARFSVRLSAGDACANITIFPEGFVEACRARNTPGLRDCVQ